MHPTEGSWGGVEGKLWRIWNYGTWCPYLTSEIGAERSRTPMYVCVGHCVSEVLIWFGFRRQTVVENLELQYYCHIHVCTYTDTGKISDWNEIKLTRGINIIPKEGISGLNHGEFGTTLWGQGEEAHTCMDLAPRDMGMQCTQANYRGTAGEGGERNWVFYCQNVFGNIKNRVTTWVTQHPPQHEIRRCSFAMISTANKVWNWGKVFSILNIGWPWVAALSLLTDSSLHIHTSMHIAF